MIAMSPADRGTRFLDEFKEFLAFQRNLGGILAGISVLFPLSNVLVKLIPLQSLDHDGAFAMLAPSLVTALAVITTLFVIRWTFWTSRLRDRISVGHARRLDRVLGAATRKARPMTTPTFGRRRRLRTIAAQGSGLGLRRRPLRRAERKEVIHVRSRQIHRRLPRRAGGTRGVPGHA
jgi:hypothetical protein